MWTRFMDMHSGGGSKEKQNYIYIEAPEEEAKTIFYNRFGHNPERVTCTCCGDDYSISEGETLAQVSAYDRNAAYDEDAKEYVERQRTKYNFGNKPLVTVEEYEKMPDVLVVRASEIKDGERSGTVPAQGYVWVE